ncbi:PP2C family protein-serine/threonine phosphatase [Nocardiopsis changdeensis]|uniref:Fused response regulator/phosphatase n=1 Tax=Nocardiopsis changdeensis TaxID=2831969 RepID=A0ABX8BL85_9ACTN|nr:fused response regulator/phosphatase [Nocardiopsis changdeensis]QUX21666.1 fused response regulator/phosphatase [Nocardiopsis changdeensis]QYX37600.1 fused response regulator/phosphatase [Nocardiopsis sp. MT53]
MIGTGTAHTAPADGVAADGRAALGDAVLNERVEAAVESVDVLLIEDDAGDAFLAEELLAETALTTRITWVATLEEARDHLKGFRGCVLLDLNLPDAHGLDLLREVLQSAPSAAVVVLTGLDDEHEGVAAVSAGAQDYLVKGQVDGSLLGRSLRYSLERRRADENAHQLREARLRARENMRLERGLLPQVLLQRSPLSHRTYYRPGRKRAIVGGDFYDAVEKDGTTHVIIGDVSGHGPDEAALGVSLRIAWRTLIMAGVAESTVLPNLEAILVSERAQEEMYATLCMASMDTGDDRVRLRVLGHPPPMIVRDTSVAETPVTPQPPLGVFPVEDADVDEVRLPRGSSLLMYTDGLVDAYDGEPPARLEVAGLRRLVTGILEQGVSLARLPEHVVDEAERSNGGPLQDDVAMLLITHDDHGENNGDRE